jgi:hypothetical protein
MTILQPSLFFNGLSALAAFVAAYRWWVASKLTDFEAAGRMPDHETQQYMYVEVAGRKVDLFATVIEGATLNARAARAAFIAAGLQGLSVLFSLVGC